MQDFKNIDKLQKRGNGRRKSGLDMNNTFKALIEPPARKRKLKIILPILALALGGYPLLNHSAPTRTAASSFANRSTQLTAAPLGKVDHWGSLRLAAQALPTAKPTADAYCAPLPQGGKIVYAINDKVQSRVEKVLADSRVPYGMVVAIEPKTGKILAAVSHSSAQPGWEKDACFRLYPMASLFKMVTAAAALEEKKISADTPFAFNGKLTSESPKYWRVRARGRNQQMPIALAMGKSVNPVFGRLAGEFVGREPLLSCAQRFGFNQQLFPGSPVLPSTAPPPSTTDQLMLMGAGLNHEVKISPFHAAFVMGALANGGVMMTPGLANQIVDQKGACVYTQQPAPLRRIVSPEVAAELGRMLSTTVVSGTSRKAFHDRRGRPMLASIDVAAKTGSIDGKDPAGHYSWFTAYAPMKDPQIAVAALVINQDKWRIKAPYLGEQALEAFFK